MEDNVLKLLAGIDVCKRCVVRVFKTTFANYDVDDFEVSVKRGSHCGACLGILEGFTLHSVAQDIAKKMEEMKFDSPTFQIGISVPQCLVLRESSVIAYLVDSGNHSIARGFTGVKAVVKFFISKLVEKLTKKKLDPHSELFIKVDFNFSGDFVEISKLHSILSNKDSKRRKQGGNQNTKQVYRTEDIQKAVLTLADSELKKYTPCPPHSLTEAAEFTVLIYQTSIFIGGRYNKYSRQLSQTPWFVDGVRRGETSTLELIGDKLKAFTHGAEIRFQSSGREDADVRMLGSGRPFAVEIINPKITLITDEDMRKLQADINSSTTLIAVRDLQRVNKAGLELMKQGEENKEKSYRAKLWCPEPISGEAIEKLNLMKDIQLEQKTPIRVLHRRPILTRTRKVHQLSLKPIDEDGHYELTLRTQAGTYIKEFVHGDFQRTVPSLRMFLHNAIDIIELDVMDVALDWPPQVDGRLTKEIADE